MMHSLIFNDFTEFITAICDIISTPARFRHMKLLGISHFVSLQKDNHNSTEDVLKLRSANKIFKNPPCFKYYKSCMSLLGLRYMLWYIILVMNLASKFTNGAPVLISCM